MLYILQSEEQRLSHCFGVARFGKMENGQILVHLAIRSHCIACFKDVFFGVQIGQFSGRKRTGCATIFLFADQINRIIELQCANIAIQFYLVSPSPTCLPYRVWKSKICAVVCGLIPKCDRERERERERERGLVANFSPLAPTNCGQLNCPFLFLAIRDNVLCRYETTICVSVCVKERERERWNKKEIKPQ